MIRFEFRFLKPLAFFLTIVFLFQCCKAYDLHYTPIERAIGPQKKYVKIITLDDEVLLFDSIYYKNKTLYGMMKKSTKKNILEIELQKENIKEVYIHVLNKEKSRKKTIALIVIPGIIVLAGGFIVLFAYLAVKDGFDPIP